MPQHSATARIVRNPQPADTLILWLPVFLACGIGAYFGGATEPPRWAGLIVFLGMIAVGIATWRWRERSCWRWVVLAGLVAAFGFTLMQWRTAHVPTTLLDTRVWNATVTGRIDSFEHAGNLWKIVLDDAQMDGGAARYRLRLTVRQRGFVPVMGAVVQVKASLMPPSAPLLPGSFDFRRHAFYQGIGGYGYTTKILSNIPPDDQSHDYLEEYRDWLTERVYAVLQQPEAGIVAALLNGQRAGIANKTTLMLQRAGLQHIISISGLHVGMLAITVFFTCRLLMSLNMCLALHWPIKKIAAAIALLAIIFYLLVVGNSPPTLRAVLTTGVALAAIMVDREAIQMRVVALSALLILLIQPESIIDIGFQLSFCAVVGLVAFYQHTRAFWQQPFWNAAWYRKAGRALLITCATSIIATLVTAPLVLLYFQQIPILAVPSNLLADVPVAFLVMPGTFLAYLLTPFPVLGVLAIRMMGLGVTLMLAVGRLIADMPLSVWRLTSLPMVAVVGMLFGVLCLILLKNRWRYAGVGIIGVGLMSLMFFPKPDLYVMESRVVLQPDGGRLLSEGVLPKFEKTMVLQWTGTDDVAPFACTGDPCDMTVKGHKIRLVRSVAALAQACVGDFAVLVTRYYLDRPCAGKLVIDRRRVEREGATAIWLDDTIRVAASRGAALPRRPWQPVSGNNRWHWQRRVLDLTHHASEETVDDRSAQP